VSGSREEYGGNKMNKSIKNIAMLVGMTAGLTSCYYNQTYDYNGRIDNEKIDVHQGSLIKSP
jgi:hypothetical protein